MVEIEKLGLVLASVFFVWLAVLSVFFYRLARHYQRLTKGITKKDLRSVLEKILRDLELESKKIKELLQATKKLEKENIVNIQKIGLVRFNPFSETGGDQSFSLAVLDGEDNGFVLSSLHARETTRIYAKPVKKGKAAGYELSEEELRAIKRARRIKK